MSQLIQDIRQRIETQHQEAIRALEVLNRYFSESPNGIVIPKGRQRKRKIAGNSYRDKVLGVIVREWATVEEIAAKTGLLEKQVRGVLYAPALAKEIERKDSGGKTAYRLKEGSKIRTSE